MDETARIDQALTSLRDAARRGLDGISVASATAGRSRMPAPVALEVDERARLARRIDELGPWLQGPFPLAADLVPGEACRDDQRWTELDREVPQDLSGRRVLDVGCRAGYDCFEFARRGAEVVGCEWSRGIEQARLLKEVYESSARFEAIRWDGLDPQRHGLFDLVHCNRVLERVASPMNLLGQLWTLMTPGGTLLLGSSVLDAPELSAHAHFTGAWGEQGPGAGWLPGRLALRWMVETSGFGPEAWFGEGPGGQAEPPIVSLYLRAVRTERQPATGSAP
jgi:SAM-dependent methyltransferase